MVLNGGLELVYRIQCFALAGLTLLGAVCVYLHDCDHASVREQENLLLHLGHFEAAMLEDFLAAMLIAVSGILARNKQLSRLVIALLSVASAVLLFEFLAQLGILATEDQKLLSMSGQVSRILAVLLSAFCCLWAMTLGMAAYHFGHQSHGR